MTYCILQPGRLWPSLPGSMQFSSVHFTAVVQFHYTALSRRGCLKWNCKLIVSHCCSHELIVVTQKRRDAALPLSESWILSDVYMLLFHKHQCMKEACLYKAAARSTCVAPAWGFKVLFTHRSSSRQEAITNFQLANSLTEMPTLSYTYTVIIGLWYWVHSRS